MLMEEFGSDTDDEDYLPQGEELESCLEIVWKKAIRFDVRYSTLQFFQLLMELCISDL